MEKVFRKNVSVKCESATHGHVKYRNIRATMEKLVMPRITRVCVEIISENVRLKLQLSIVNMISTGLLKKNRNCMQVCVMQIWLCKAVVLSWSVVL